MGFTIVVYCNKPEVPYVIVNAMNHLTYPMNLTRYKIGKIGQTEFLEMIPFQGIYGLFNSEVNSQETNEQELKNAISRNHENQMLLFSVDTKRNMFKSELFNSIRSLNYPFIKNFKLEIEQYQKQFNKMSPLDSIQESLKYQFINEIIGIFFKATDPILQHIIAKYNLDKEKAYKRDTFFKEYINEYIDAKDREYFSDFFVGNCFTSFWEELIFFSDCSSIGSKDFEYSSNLSKYMQYIKSQFIR